MGPIANRNVESVDPPARRRCWRLRAGLLLLGGALAFGGCYVVPAQTGVRPPGPVYVAPAPVYVAPGPVYLLGSDTAGAARPLVGERRGIRTERQLAHGGLQRRVVG